MNKLSTKQSIKNIYNKVKAKIIRRSIPSLQKGITASEIMADARARGHKPIIVDDQIVIIL
jgi:hypothetical protein